MKNTRHALSAILLALTLTTVATSASARGHDDRHHGHHNHHGWGHERYERHDGYDHRRNVRIIENRYIVREAPRYYEPVYPRHAPIYRAEPGISVRIGLPPIYIPFN